MGATELNPWLAGIAIVVSACGAGGETLEDVAAGRAEVRGEGVLVIAIDGLRWDHTSLSGYDRDTTPFLASLGREGMTFSDAWSPSPSLVGAHVGILSGSDPLLAQPPTDTLMAEGDPTTAAGRSVAARIDEIPWFIPEDLWLLGQSFLSHGWNTAAFVDDPMIAELRGFSGGFRSFVEFGGDPLAEERSIGVFGVGRRFVRWVNARPLDENWFAYLHMHDLERVWVPSGDLTKTRGVSSATSDWRLRPELDFAVPLGVTEPLFHVLPPSRASRVRGVTLAEYELRYDRGMRALDANLQRIVGHADEYGRADHLTVVIVGSFGVELGEHGLYLQAGLVEEEDLRVPVVIRPSRAIREKLGWEVRPAGEERRSDALVSLIDVTPTLVDLLNLPHPGGMLGRSMRPLMERARDGASEPEVEASIRSRLFATSAQPPGMAVVEDRVRLSVYEPSRASDSLRRSWHKGGSAAAAIEVVARGGSGSEVSESTSARLRDAAEGWKSLLLRERRALHFGAPDSDRPAAERLRALQSSRPGK